MKLLLTATTLLLLTTGMASGQDFLSTIKVVPGSTSATITWTSAVPAEVRVFYTYNNQTFYTARTTTYTLSHSVKLSGLSSNAQYHFTLRNFDNAGDQALATGTFTTLVLSSHLVDLSWNPSTSTNVVAYDVYRGKTAAGPYSRIASSVPGAAYTDTNMASGTTYYYVVTAVSNQGGQSAYSNQAVATIP